MTSFVQKQVRKVTKSSEVKDEMLMIMGPHQNWEQYLVPAPYTVKILANILRISLNQDFSLENKPPKGGFKKMKHPGSFRASLVQVAGDGYKAFNTAQKSMDEIRLKCHQMPDDFKEALGILFHGSPEDVEDMLHIPLGKIEEAAHSCKTLAEEVGDRFDDVQDLTQELLEVCTSNQGHYEDAAKQAEARARIKAKRMERLKKREKMQEEQFEKMKKDLDTADERYKEAMDSIPGGWEVIGMNFVDGLLKTVNNVLDPIGTIAGYFEDDDDDEGGEEEEEGTVKKSKPAMAEKGMIDLVKDASKIQSIPEGLKEFFPTEKNPETKKSERKLVFKNESEKALIHLLTQINEVKTSVDGAEPKREDNLNLKNKTAKVVTDLIGFIEDLQEKAKNMNDSDADPVELHANLLNLWTAAGRVETLVNNRTKEPPLGTSGPNAKNAKPKMTSRAQAKSAGQSAVESAKFKVSQSKEYLADTRQGFKDAQTLYFETCDRMDEVIEQLQIAKDEKIEFDKIKKVLTAGIKALGELREQWAKLVTFFQMVRNLIKVSLHGAVDKFLQYARTGEEKRIGGMTLSKLHQDMVYNNSFKAIKIAYLVEHISTAYVNMSSTHITHRMAGLAKILGYDAEKEKDKIEAEMQKINDGCDEAQKQIKVQIAKEKRDYMANIGKRVNKIQRELDATLPNPPEEVMKAIENSGKELRKDLIEDKGLEADDDEGIEDDDFLDMSELFD